MDSELRERFGIEYRQGTVLFREGDHSDCMYIIQEGEVAITKKSKQSEHMLAVFTNGDFFGEMALFTTPERSATATAVKDSFILKIDKSSFDYMVKNNVPFAIRMIEKLCERLKKADDQLGELLSIGEQTKIIKALMDYWKIAGKNDASGSNVLIPYQGFLTFVSNKFTYSAEKMKSVLLELKQQELLKIKKDTQGKIYISISPRVFSYFNVI